MPLELRRAHLALAAAGLERLHRGCGPRPPTRSFAYLPVAAGGPLAEAHPPAGAHGCWRVLGQGELSSAPVATIYSGTSAIAADAHVMAADVLCHGVEI